jgi:RNA polymerase sigma-70 factor (ECF subfamily)
MIEELLYQVKKKKRKAQQEFYNKYSRRMFILTYRYVNNEHDAGSIVNKGFFNIFNKLNKFIYINEKALIGWMKKIMINEALIFIRNRITYDDIDQNKPDIFIATDIPESNLLLDDYYNLIKELPDDLRTVFNMYAIDGFPHKEIAEKLKIKESSSRVYLSRARKILQQNLTKS